VATLRDRNVRPAFVMDEGGSLTEGVVPGVDGTIALVGTAEKGYLSLRLTAKGEEGHSSMPPRRTSVGILAQAITRVEAAPMPARLDGATRAMLETLAPAMPVAQRAAIANLWLTRPLLLSRLDGTPSGNATIRTTTAPTMLQGSTKDNVMPGTASAVVNFRLLPGDRIADVLRHVREAIDDERVTVDTLAGLAVEPSPTSPTDNDGFRAIAAAIRGTWPTARVSPYLLVGATDSRYLAALTPNVYRFAPLRLGPEDLKRIHGTNERIAVRDYVDGVRFLRRLVVLAAS
jgi:carboxypeptidase PM20D1